MEMQRMLKEWDCKQMEMENMQKEWDCKQMEIERMQKKWDCKHMEMEMMQKERDDALMKIEVMQEESCRLWSYGQHLKDHVHKLVTKLREYPQKIIKAQGQVDDEWERLHRSVALLETGLQEFQDKNQKTEERADALSSQLSEARVTISDLQNQINWLQGQVETLQEKNVASLKEKVELDTAAQMREAAISVLRLRLYALQCELQKERFFRMNKMPDSDAQSATPVSSDAESKPSGRCAPVHEMEDDIKTTWSGRYEESPEHPVIELEEESVHESQQDSVLESQQDSVLESRPESINDCATETTLADTAISFETESQRSMESWNRIKMKKLEQALTEAHRRYMLISKGEPDKISVTDNSMEGSQSATLQEADDVNLQLRPPLIEIRLPQPRSQDIDNRDTSDIIFPVVNKFPKKVRFKEDSPVELEDMQAENL